MKPRTINVRQTPTGEFRVESFVNTLDLTVGQIVKREKLDAWNVYPSVRINVLGLVPEDETKENKLK